MGKIIRSQRRGKSGQCKVSSHRRLGAAKFRPLDITEKMGYIKGVVENIYHDPGRGAPLAVVSFRDQMSSGKKKEIFIIPEGIHTGQAIYCGSTAELKFGNILPIGRMPEGTLAFNVESIPGDGGKFARASGESISIISHNKDENKTVASLPSGRKKEFSSNCRAAVGIVAGGGRTEKPLLKAGRVHHKFRARRKTWPLVSGVAMNPVDHPHGGGNHQHLGHPSTVSRHTPRGRKVGLIAARRTGRRVGSDRKLSK